MIRIEIDARTRKNEFKASGIMPILYGEAGMAMTLIYRTFRENFPEERAKEMMYRLLERSTLTDEEIEEAVRKREKEEPELDEVTEELLKFIRSGEKEEARERVEKAFERLRRKKDGNAG